MFHSAILKLTGWYLLILMSISVLFSIAIYNITTNEIQGRLSDFENRVAPDIAFTPDHRLFSEFRYDQNEAASRNIFVSLVWVNLLIMAGGGALSYWLARRTLHHIELAHEAQSRFTSDASHELRTPLSAMKSELEVTLRDPKISKSEMQEVLKSNLEEVNKLTSLSQTLLNLSRMDYASVVMEQMNLSDIASEVVQRYDKNATRIELTLPKQPPIVKANVTGIE